MMINDCENVVENIDNYYKVEAKLYSRTAHILYTSCKACHQHIPIIQIFLNAFKISRIKCMCHK